MNGGLPKIAPWPRPSGSFLGKIGKAGTQTITSLAWMSSSGWRKSILPRLEQKYDITSDERIQVALESIEKDWPQPEPKRNF